MKPIKFLFTGTLALTFTLALCLVVQMAQASPISRIEIEHDIPPSNLMPVDGMLVALPNLEVSVMRAVACSSIENREPVGVNTEFETNVGRVYCYTKVELPSGTTQEIKHVWKRNGKIMSTVQLTVKGPAYRTRSYKTITSRMAGDWTVEIQSSNGELLDTVPFTIQ